MNDATKLTDFRRVRKIASSLGIFVSTGILLTLTASAGPAVKLDEMFIIATDITETSITITWTEPSDGKPSFYDVAWKENVPDARWRGGFPHGRVQMRSFKITGLRTNTEYVVTINATFLRLGKSYWGSQFFFRLRKDEGSGLSILNTTPIVYRDDILDMPYPKVIERGIGSIHLEWDPVPHATLYLIQYDHRGLPGGFGDNRKPEDRYGFTDKTNFNIEDIRTDAIWNWASIRVTAMAEDFVPRSNIIHVWIGVEHLPRPVDFDVIPIPIGGGTYCLTSWKTPAPTNWFSLDLTFHSLEYRFKGQDEWMRYGSFINKGQGPIILDSGTYQFRLTATKPNTIYLPSSVTIEKRIP